MQKNIENQFTSVFFGRTTFAPAKKAGKKAHIVANLFHPIAGWINEVAIFEEAAGFGQYQTSDRLEGFLTISDTKRVFNVTKHVVSKKNLTAAA